MARKRKIKTYIDYDTKTIYLQHPVTGDMEGRRRVKGLGDGTAVKRARASGEIFGRTPSILGDKRKVGLAKASLSTRKRVSSMGGRAR